MSFVISFTVFRIILTLLWYHQREVSVRSNVLIALAIRPAKSGLLPRFSVQPYQTRGHNIDHDSSQYLSSGAAKRL